MYLNWVQLIGKVIIAPTIKGLGATEFVSFALVTTLSYKDKNGVQQNKVDRHNISVFGPKSTEYVMRNIKEGSYVFVEGELRYSTFEKNEVSMAVANIAVNAYKGTILLLREDKPEKPFSKLNQDDDCIPF